MEPKSPKSCIQMKGSRNEEVMSTFVGKWVMVAAERTLNSQNKQTLRMCAMAHAWPFFKIFLIFLLKILRTCSLLTILTCLFNPRDFQCLLSLTYPAWHLNLASPLAYYLPNYPPLIYALCYVINYQLFSDYGSLHNNHYRIPLNEIASLIKYFLAW